jgi:RNA polymerase sigma-70 factor (ECF subfamily)
MPRPPFEEIVEMYDRRLYNVLCAFTGDQDEALDIAQETFISAYKAYGKFRGDADPFTWLYRIGINLFRKRYGRKKRRESLWAKQMEEEPPKVIDTHTPVDDLEATERSRLVRQAISKLPEKQREAVIFKYLNDYSYEEIAELAGCSIGTVKSRLSRAKRALAEILEGMGLIEDESDIETCEG